MFYTKTSLRFVLFLILSLCVQPAFTETIPALGEVDPRIRVAHYDPNDVINLPGYVGHQIHIQWEEGEMFDGLGAGDNALFDVGTLRNHFFIKPKVVADHTNLTIITNKRAYHFDYKIQAKPVGGISKVIYSLRYIYPEQEAKLAANRLSQARINENFQKTSINQVRNGNYWFCGDDSIKPISAFDDGVHTRIRFAARNEFPAIFVKNDDDTESLLNFNIEDDEVVIHRIAKEIILRRGKLVGCVVNKSFEGGGAKPKNNTVSHDVERRTKGIQP